MRNRRINKAFMEAASQRAQQQMKSHMDRLSDQGYARSCRIDPRLAETTKLPDNDGAVLDIKKRIRKIN
ncbi:hypothetical protein C772_01405 [Bhargavaea cecembensis DSE10]|uniref:Uncharacterized protein n=1 Tax=Bhargavaea cecembensis DSE10 TaxID=1235279 RepID=M7NXW1_9BACL|nr:hypothetical protein [Bhargavaea cecembensis]EMR06510.1 hypothetical protein C772_01405 [Bhargavaea cecembensis DSE10]